jgi:hypothetical protein
MQCVKAESREETHVSAMAWAMAASLLVAAALALPGSAYPLEDVRGWQTTRWGMTESEVKRSVESLGLRVTSLPGPHGGALEAETPFKTSIEIDGSDYDVIFQFSGETHRLGRILIRTLDFSREHALTFYGSLRRALAEEYGPPAETQSRGTVASTTEWAFKTTTVVLSVYTETGARAPHVSQVSVTYSPTAAAPKDTKDKLLGLGLLRALGEAGRSLR